MSERILQHVLEDLRPRCVSLYVSRAENSTHTQCRLLGSILAKLTDEADATLGQGGPANAKRSVVDVHRGGNVLDVCVSILRSLIFVLALETYQFGYFLRKTDPHSVLIKVRTGV